MRPMFHIQSQNSHFTRIIMFLKKVLELPRPALPELARLVCYAYVRAYGDSKTSQESMYIPVHQW